MLLKFFTKIYKIQGYDSWTIEYQRSLEVDNNNCVHVHQIMFTHSQGLPYHVSPKCILSFVNR